MNLCIDCEKPLKAARRAKNSHKEKEANKLRMRKEALENPDKVRERKRSWLAKNPEKVRQYASNPQKLITRRKRYHLTRAARNVQTRAYRARKRNAPGNATLQQVQWRSAMFGDKCWMCGVPATCMDHVKPIKAGGSNWPANQRPACKPCNSRKMSRWYGVENLARFSSRRTLESQG